MRVTRRCKRRSYASPPLELPAGDSTSAHVFVMKSYIPDMDEGGMNSSGTPKRPLYPVFESSEEPGSDELDGVEDVAAPHIEKKRRLSLEQVKSLEKYFEQENKLEPERKLQLARELGLQPRQVAVWFQNRRARWKTKQLEKDYDALKADLDALKGDFKKVLQEKDKLESEVVRLNELLGSKPEVSKPPRLKVEVGEDPPGIESKVQVSSSDSDDSEIVDEESTPRPIESGFSLHHDHHQALDMDQLQCHIPDHEQQGFESVVYPRIIPKLEEPCSFQDDSTTVGFLDLEEQDQGSICWWDWP